MIDKFQLSTSWTATTRQAPFATTAAVNVEVTRSRLQPQDKYHTFGVWPHGGVMPYTPWRHPKASRQELKDTHEHITAFVGFSLIASLLLLLLGCVVVQVCNSALTCLRRQSTPRLSPPRPRRRQRRHDEVQGQELRAVMELHVELESDRDDSSGGEEVNSSRVSPAPCSNHQTTHSVVQIPDNPDQSETRIIEATYKQNCPYISVELDSRNAPSITDTSLQLYPQPNVSRQGVEDQGMYSPSKLDDIACDDHVCKIAGEQCDERESCVLTDVASDEELSSEIDDLSQCLAALEFDLTNVLDGSYAADAGGDDIQGSDDDGAGASDESFSRLRKVQAQAEFSPYHIAWSMPRSVDHKPARDGDDLESINLNTQLFGREDSEINSCHPNVGADQGTEDSANDSGCSGRVETCDRQEAHELTMTCPSQQDTVKSPCRHEEKSPDTEDETEEQEYQPLLASSTDQYRGRLVTNTGPATKDDSTSSKSSCSESPSFFHHRSPCPGAQLNNNLMFSPLAGPDRGSVDQSPRRQHCSQVDSENNAIILVEECRALPEREPERQDKKLQDTRRSLADSRNNQVIFQDSDWILADSPKVKSHITSQLANKPVSVVKPVPTRMKNVNVDISVGCGIDSESIAATPAKGGQSLMRQSSPLRKQNEDFDNFKTPLPVSAIKFKPLSAYSTRTIDDRQRTSWLKSKPSAVHSPTAELQMTPLPRARTSQSTCSSAQTCRELLSVSTAGDISVVSSISRLSIYGDTSLMWDNEVSASVCMTNESLAWEDDPCL